LDAPAKARPWLTTSLEHRPRRLAAEMLHRAVSAGDCPISERKARLARPQISRLGKLFDGVVVAKIRFA